MPDIKVWTEWEDGQARDEGQEKAGLQNPENESFDPRDNRMQDVYGPPPFPLPEGLLEMDDPLPQFVAESWDDPEILRPEDNVPEVVYGPPSFPEWDEPGTVYFEVEDPWDADPELEGDGSDDLRPIRPEDSDSTPELIDPFALEWE